MADKLGSYINTLMTTVVDKEQDEFVKELALETLVGLSDKIQEFINKHKDDSEKTNKTIKKLLQEEKKHGND
jgi:hypothetical protein